MNLTAIAIVALICWAIVELVNGPKGKKKNQTTEEHGQEGVFGLLKYGLNTELGICLWN